MTTPLVATSRGRGRGTGRNLVPYRLPNGQILTIPYRQLNAITSYFNSISHPSNPLTDPTIPNLSMPAPSGRNLRRNPNVWLNPSVSRFNPSIARPTDTQILAKEEKWFDVVPGANKYIFYPGSSGVPQLDRFASIYENYQIRYAVIKYKPSSGTTVPGNITMGIDYNPNGPDRKPSDIPLLEPNYSGTIFQAGCLKIVINRVMKGLSWLYTSAAGTDDPASKSFALYIDAKTEAESVGQIWFEYKIAFSTATSPVGIAGAVAIPLAITQTEIVSNIQISPPNDLVVDNQALEQPPVVLEESISTVDATSEQTTFESTFRYDNEQFKPGDTLTVGTLVTTTPENHLHRAATFKPPSISFKYADGTPIPTGSIVPLSAAPRIIAPYQSDIFATLFSVAKPLLKPFVGIIQDFLAPLSYSPTFNADEESQILDTDPDKLLSFSFAGDTASIQVPILNEDPIASRLSTNLMVYMGRGVAGGIEDYISVYDYNVWSYENNWLENVKLTSSNSDSKIIVTYANIDETVQSFHTGDLFFAHLAILPLDSGFGDNVKTPFPCPMTEAQVTALVNSISQNSYLSNDKDVKPVDSPVLTTIFIKNNTSADKSGSNVGLSLGLRFIGSSTDYYRYMVFNMALGPWAGSIRKQDSNISKPEAGYALGAGLLQTQFFTTSFSEAVSSSFLTDTPSFTASKI